MIGEAKRGGLTDCTHGIRAQLRFNTSNLGGVSLEQLVLLPLGVALLEKANVVLHGLFLGHA